MNLARGIRATTEILNPGGTSNTRFRLKGACRSDEGTSTVAGTSAAGRVLPEARAGFSAANAGSEANASAVATFIHGICRGIWYLNEATLLLYGT
jgi:hypothetical protein